jgi:hypothetical protein
MNSSPGRWIAVAMSSIVTSVLGGILLGSGTFGTESATVAPLTAAQPAPASHTWRPSATSITRHVYVDCTAGKDDNSGSRSAPLRTVAAATAATVPSGTEIDLARGCTWAGGVTLRGDGTAKAPIILGAYGTGADPVLTGAPGLTGVISLQGTYQVVQNVRVTGAAGTGIEVRGEHDLVRQTEIDDVGLGVVFTGASGTATGVAVHDLHMVVDTAGGDDDYGAVGFDVQAGDIEISASSCTHCRAPSHDYGYDGGFAEVWNYGDALSLHDNTGDDTAGILEIGGGSATSSARGISIRDNTFRDAHGGFVVHTTGPFAIAATSVTVSGNTIVNSDASDGPVLSGYVPAIAFDGNTVTTPAEVSDGGTPGTHRCNVYPKSSPDRLGYRASSSESLSTTARSPGCG